MLTQHKEAVEFGQISSHNNIKYFEKSSAQTYG